MSSIAFRLTGLFNICRFKQTSLPVSWLCITSPLPNENFWPLISLYAAFTERGDVLNYMEIYLKSDRRTQLVNREER